MNRAALIAFLQPLLARLVEQLADVMLEEGELALESARGVAMSRLEEAFAIVKAAPAIHDDAHEAELVQPATTKVVRVRCKQCGELGHNARRHKKTAASSSDEEDEPVVGSARAAIAEVVAPLFADVLVVDVKPPPPDRSEGLHRGPTGHACSRSPGIASRRRGGQPSSTVTRRSRTSTPGTWCAGD